MTDMTNKEVADVFGGEGILDALEGIEITLRILERRGFPADRAREPYKSLRAAGVTGDGVKKILDILRTENEVIELRETMAQFESLSPEAQEAARA